MSIFSVAKTKSESGYIFKNCEKSVGKNETENQIYEPENENLLKNSETTANINSISDSDGKKIVELFLLNNKNDGKKYWNIVGRWIKYEEYIDEKNGKFSNPRIPILAYDSIFTLQNLLKNGAIIFDMDKNNIQDIVFSAVEYLTINGKGVDIFYDKAKFMKLFDLEFIKRISGDRLINKRNCTKLDSESSNNIKFGSTFNIEAPDYKENIKTSGRRRSIVSWLPESFKKNNENENQVLSNREGSLVLIGKDGSVKTTFVSFIRLKNIQYFTHVSDTFIPIRFIFVLIGSQESKEDYLIEIGRSVSTLLTNSVFLKLARQSKDYNHVFSGIKLFLKESIIFPSSNWDYSLLDFNHKNQLKNKLMKDARNENERKKSIVSAVTNLEFTEMSGKMLEFNKQDEFERKKKVFGGFLCDFRKRFPYYVTDIVDGFSLQCLATILFVYFGCVAGNIAFGGLMGAKTENWIGISETLVSAAVGGGIFALISAQPLLVIGTTGPLLIFDQSLFRLCKSYEMSGGEFLVVRSWIGVWLTIISLIFTAFEGSCLIRYFTRFTQEIFSTLISLLFIVESLMSLFKQYGIHPILASYVECKGDEFDETSCGIPSRPNVALLSTILMLGTYHLATVLKKFRTSAYMTQTVRNTVSNFGVPLALALMTALDFILKDVETEKLNLPDSSGGISNSLENRTWLINPLENITKNPFGIWITLLTFFPAVLLFIFTFMETSIAELIISKDEMKLKKGSGFHLNVVILGLINTILGFLGSSWVTAPTIRSFVHVSSLTVFSKNLVPGEKPSIVGVKEQRLTGLVVSILIGLSVFMASLLRNVPMAALFGIFLYMGITSLSGVQFVERIKILFKQTQKYPPFSFATNVHRLKMHLFTVIQLICLAILWGVKESPFSLILALLIILLIPIRFMILTKIFTSTELEELDC